MYLTRDAAGHRQIDSYRYIEKDRENTVCARERWRESVSYAREREREIEEYMLVKRDKTMHIGKDG